MRLLIISVTYLCWVLVAVGFVCFVGVFVLWGFFSWEA